MLSSAITPRQRRIARRIRKKKQHEARDLAPPPATAQSSRKQHEARGLCHSAGRQLRELEKATRGSGTLPLRRPAARNSGNTRLQGLCHPPADSSELEKATRGSGTLPLRRPTAQRLEKQHEARGLCPPPAAAQKSSKQHEAQGLCHSAGRQLRGSSALTRLGDFAPRKADSSESSRKQHEDFATPPADSSESSKATRGSGTLPSAGRQLRSSRSNTRLRDFATPPADSSELEKATRGSGTLPLRRPTAQRSSRKQHEARGLCHSAGRQLRELESNTRLRDFATPSAYSLESSKATRGSGTLPSAGRQLRELENTAQIENLSCHNIRTQISKKHYGER
ncbi:hypothetical protein PUN28_020363 [Cardiocondyla obscurior]|uniref:Uncharacterized protein n=1 Tax=Cardiocondyla obscurior TaxID=286306 RepID=A0AAW2E9G6_9HYME